MSNDSQNKNSTPRSRRILVIEDNIDSAEVLQTFLEINGHEITVTHNAMDGLSAINQASPEIVICDISLAGETDGYEIAKEIRQKEPLNSILLIALSGYGRPEDKEKSKNAGFNEHLTKPTDFDQLLNLINSFD